MDEQQRINLQWQREVDSINSAFEEILKRETQDFKFGNGSNSILFRSIKRTLLENTITYLQWELDIAKDPLKRHSGLSFKKACEATEAIKKCLGVNIVTRKVGDAYEDYVSQHRRNWFNLDKAAFIAVQMTLDNTMAPMVSVDEQNPQTGQWRKSPRRRTYTELADYVGKKVETEVRFTMLSQNLGGFFNWANKEAAGRNDKEQMPSSTAYWETRIKDLLLQKREALATDKDLDPELKAAMIESLIWKPWSHKERVHVGKWLLRGLLKGDTKTKMLEVKRLNKDGRQGEFIVLSSKGEEHQTKVYDDVYAYCYDEQPMLCPPVPNTKKKLRGYLAPTAWVRPPSKDGWLKMSDTHLDFINRLQRVPYRINPFVLKLMDHLAQHDMELGKFKRYWFKNPSSVAQRLGLGSLHDFDEQTDAVVNHPDFKKAKAQRSKDIGRERKKIVDGSMTRKLHKMCRESKDLDMFWIPCYWDFRGRVYYRCDLNPQSSDPFKATLQFANPTKVDQYTALFLKLSISAAAGKDKLSEDDRKSWVDSVEADIINVAKMFDDDGDFQKAISFIESELGSDPWEGLAACEEYYWCCLAPKERRRTVTHFRCSQDATASGAQLTSGFRRSRSSAYKVNVLKRNEGPGDVYLQVWNEIVDRVTHDPQGNIRPVILRYLKETNKGRKLAKLCYMSGQYGSGLDVQKRDFLKYHDNDIPKNRRMTEAELELVFKHLTAAIDKVSSITTFVQWMRRRTIAALEGERRSFNTPAANGNVCMSRYPERKAKSINTFHYGSAKVDHQFNTLEATKTPDKSSWIKACAANAIHVQDASLLSLAYSDWELNLSCVHDCVCSAPGMSMMLLRHKFKLAYVQTISWDFWKGIYKANGLKFDEDMYAAVCEMDTFEPSEAMEANYIIC